MIRVHYGDNSTYDMTDNRWAKVPNKDDIVAVDIVREVDGRVFTLKQPEGTTVKFFSQRIGYAHIAPGRAVQSLPIVEEQVGMIFDENHVELLEVGAREKRYSTTFKKMGFSQLSLKLLGL